MSRLFPIVFSLCFLATLVTGSAYAEGEPSDCAKGMPGATGTFEFAPPDRLEGQTTWWKDTDGIAPEVPGCHVATESNGVENGRFFGEACLPDGRLVESNPGAYKLHSHKDDLGHPDTFDCNAWCIGSGRPKGGKCEVVTQNVPKPCTKSAKCSCN